MPAMKPIMMIQIMFDTVISPLAFACNVADETCKDPLSSEAPYNYTKSRLSRPLHLLANAVKWFPETTGELLITEACGWCYDRPTGPKSGTAARRSVGGFFLFSACRAIPGCGLPCGLSSAFL